MRKRQRKNKVKFVILAIIVVIFGIFVWRENQKIVICLDAGHGGKDAGSVASNGKRYEKDDNLKIVLAIQKELEKQDIKVVLTRNKDESVSLLKRCQIANLRRADLFVSVHRNSSKSGDGVEIWISQEKDKISEKLANTILNQLQKTQIQTNRGVKSGTSENKQGDYFVNRNTKMPSCLIELGFISNNKDNQLLDENLEQYAEAIAKGILENIEQK